MSNLPHDIVEWVADLRSGKYQQASGKLRDEEGMCCLGVYCDGVAPEGWTYDETNQEWTHFGEVCFPSDAILHNSSMTFEDAEYFASLNDDLGLSFAEIADEAESYFSKDGK